MHPMTVAVGSALAAIGIEPQPYKASKISVSQLAITSEFRTVVGELRRQQVMDVVRGATFIGTLLLAWISLRPFVDLGELQIGDVSTGNEAPTYAGVRRPGGADARAGDARQHARAGDVAVAGVSCCSAAGCCVTVVLSLDPGTSIRRFALTACVIAVAATLMLLPKSQNELMRWLSIAALVAAGDLLSRNPAGAASVDPSGDRCRRSRRWPATGAARSATRTCAAAVMAMLLFIGIYVARSGALAVGRGDHRPCRRCFCLCRRQELADAVLCGVAADSLTSVFSSFWLRAVMLLDAAAAAQYAQRRHGHERQACRNRKDAAARHHLYRPHRHLDLCVPGAAAAAVDRLRLRGVLGHAARSRICPKARSGRSSPRTATTAISTPRWRWACRDCCC